MTFLNNLAWLTLGGRALPRSATDTPFRGSDMAYALLNKWGSFEIAEGRGSKSRRPL